MVKLSFKTTALIILFAGLLMFLYFKNRKKVIRDDFKLYYYDNYGYCNVYLGGMAVLPSGCDSAKWNDLIIVTKSDKWRCSIDKECYFIIDMNKYLADPRQELSSGVKGPYSLEEFSLIDPLKEVSFEGAY